MPGILPPCYQGGSVYLNAGQVKTITFLMPFLHNNYSALSGTALGAHNCNIGGLAKTNTAISIAGVSDLASQNWWCCCGY